MSRAVIYARFSSDLQRASSIDDQILAETQGYCLSDNPESKRTKFGDLSRTWRQTIVIENDGTSGATITMACELAASGLPAAFNCDHDTLTKSEKSPRPVQNWQVGSIALSQRDVRPKTSKLNILCPLPCAQSRDQGRERRQRRMRRKKLGRLGSRQSSTIAMPFSFNTSSDFKTACCARTALSQAHPNRRGPRKAAIGNELPKWQLRLRALVGEITHISTHRFARANGEPPNW